MRKYYAKGVEELRKEPPSNFLCDRNVFKGQDLVIFGDSVEVSDGYHTMDELYEHRIALFIALCRLTARDHENEMSALPEYEVWRSKQHHPVDTPMYDGYFVLGIHQEARKQISYHIPLYLWNECGFAETLGHAPRWDGHTSADVLERLKTV